MPGWLDVEGGRCAWNKAVDRPRYWSCRSPFPARDNRLDVEWTPSGVGVIISGDFPASRFALYTDPNGVCPEVFFGTVVEPGQTARWSRRYTFYEETNSDQPAGPMNQPPQPVNGLR